MDWQQEKLVRLINFSPEEYTKLSRTGLLYEIYEWATGYYTKDKATARHKLELLTNGVWE